MNQQMKPVISTFFKDLASSEKKAGPVLLLCMDILTALFIILKLKVDQLPATINWYHVLALGFIANLGFTMAIFIAQLPFAENGLIQSPKIGYFSRIRNSRMRWITVILLRKSPPTKPTL